MEEFQENRERETNEVYSITPFGIDRLDDIPFWVEAKYSMDSTLGSYWWGPNLDCTLSIVDEIHSHYPVSADSLKSIVPLVSSEEPTEL